MAGYSLDGMGRQAPRIRPEPLPPPDPAAAGKQAAIDGLLEDGPTGPPEVEPYWLTNPGAYNRQPNMTPGPASGNAVQRGMGLGLSRFASALNNNETDTLGRYGESPLFSGLMLQQGGTGAAEPPAPESDLLQDFRSRRTGGVSPYRRRAIDALLGGA